MYISKNLLKCNISNIFFLLGTVPNSFNSLVILINNFYLQLELYLKLLVILDNAPELPDLTLIPDHVQKPGYYYTGKPEVVPQVPVIWNLEQIDKV